MAWYAKLKPAKANDPDCSCETKNSHSFLQSKSFLGIITVFSIMMMTFPLYAKIFYHAPEVKSSSVAKTEGKLTAIFIIDGMTCAGCEVTVNNELSKLKGVWNYTTSYARKNSQVTYNPEIIDVKTIASAINKTGYTVKKWKIQ
jgi:copper chaperone CopZ